VLQGKTIDELLAMVSLVEHRSKQHTESQGSEIEGGASKELHVEDSFLLGSA
jgi:hypothetical protein